MYLNVERNRVQKYFNYSPGNRQNQQNIKEKYVDSFNTRSSN